MSIHFFIYLAMVVLAIIVKTKVISALSMKKRTMVAHAREEREQQKNLKNEFHQIQEQRDTFKDIILEKKEEDHKASNWWRRILGD